jgi:hypothetical protein
VVTKSPPDTSLRRLDFFIKRYDEPHDTLNALVLVKFKGLDGNAKLIEKQVRSRIKDYIRADGLH